MILILSWAVHFVAKNCGLLGRSRWGRLLWDGGFKSEGFFTLELVKRESENILGNIPGR